MGTLIKKLTSNFSHLSLKTLKSIICFSGFPKKTCQGSLISEGANYFLIKIIFSKPRYLYYPGHANAISGNSMSISRGVCGLIVQAVDWNRAVNREMAQYAVSVFLWGFHQMRESLITCKQPTTSQRKCRKTEESSLPYPIEKYEYTE